MGKKPGQIDYFKLYGEVKTEEDKERRNLMAEGITYKLVEGGILCLRCNRVSTNTVDVREKYCSSCSWHHTDPKPQSEPPKRYKR